MQCHKFLTLGFLSRKKTKNSAEAELFVYRNNPEWVIISWRTAVRGEQP